MKSKSPKLFFALLLSLLMLGGARPGLACGPFSLDAVFVFNVHPDFPLERFTRGEVGVVQPTYARSYLYAAYRQMSGTGFSREEQSALLELWKQRLDFSWKDDEAYATKIWLDARKQIPGVGEPPNIGEYRSREKPNDYETYLNCQQDAFETAAETLAARIKKFGAESPLLKEWVAAQDTVFANCSEGQNIPAPASADADPIIRADRAYQIAAANFYATRFDEAGAGFEQISRDAASPWRPAASYLVARTFLRKASLNDDAAVKTEALTAAEKQLRRVLDDKTLSATHADAKRLLSLVRLRLHPEERLHELARDVLRRDAREGLKQDVWDYTLLLDKFVGEDSAVEVKFDAVPAAVRGDDLSDWITTFQVQDKAALEHALQKWEQTSSLPWLVAALSKLDANHTKTPALLEAASKAKTDTPGYASVAFHSIRLLLESGREEEARSRLDSLLAPKTRATLPPSARNLLLSQRMSLARNLEEFLQFAQRNPSGFTWNEDGREIPATTEDVSQDEDKKIYADGRALFDADAARIINEQLPLSLLRQAATSSALPEHLRRRLAIAAWVRSVMLDEREIGKELVPVVESLAPELKGYLDADLRAANNEARKFSAVYAILKFPGLQPYVDAGVGRTTPLGNIDNYRDNWWCAQETTPASTSQAKDEAGAETKTVASKSPAKQLNFLDARQKAEATRETRRLSAFGTAPNYLARLAVEWANKTPDDPRLPEALHLAVKTTRFGCTDEQTPALSKSAFQLLHKRFPKSDWAKKTPYWFKNT